MRSVILAIILSGAGCGFSVHGSATTDGAVDDIAVDARRDAPVDVAIDVAIDASPDAPAPSCTNAIQDGDETDVNCGGSTCAPCDVGKACLAPTDCLASVCDTTSTCRVALHCRELHQAQPSLGDGAYVIDPDGTGAATAVTTFCDMATDGGGWTLVGKVDGKQTMFTTWLVANTNVADLATTTITANSYASIAAVELAVNGSTEVRLSNAARTSWAKWPLPAGRLTTTFWNHAVGQLTVNAATDLAVTVTTSLGTTEACFQNVYGINPWDGHGGAYPFASHNTAGNTRGNDWCMSIGTQNTGTSDGFTQNGNGFDAPASDTVWPNTTYNVIPHVAVWLR